MPRRYIHKRLSSFGYALKGIVTAFKSEPHMKLHTLSAVIVVVLGFYFTITRTEWVLLILAMGMVISAEIMNTAVEKLTDLVTKEYHPLAGKAKDLAAGAVLVAAIAAAVIGLLVLGPYFLKEF
ncbi:MAG: diacylglycerol kinase family protein [Hymenobacteraceae bacterium]|nr:diacylglycerol kinase family protein [Hymenobacteraceae bacterium]MDX5397100.1 diacylglycerol kinase family protein [Hymenobacteraceae bacterium]MDX5442420.1 diacylglycerol kinase family protein [Hymenobacteraceae bacterium]MDX5513178.1 diacylglycerol kinase family protein [Hymenobacteraceae bacterium]